jgi:putative SOS response-associated peptidase YedK
MCYYNGIKIPREEFIRIKEIQKELKELSVIRPMQSGFDYSDWPIVKPKAGVKDFDVEMAHWEFVPFWIKNGMQLAESRKKFTTLNATCENMLESKMYREAALKRRCLVLSSGFYEWRHYKPESAKKDIAYPYYISLPGKSFFLHGRNTAAMERQGYRGNL